MYFSSKRTLFHYRPDLHPVLTRFMREEKALNTPVLLRTSMSKVKDNSVP